MLYPLISLRVLISGAPLAHPVEAACGRNKLERQVNNAPPPHPYSDRPQFIQCFEKGSRLPPKGWLHLGQRDFANSANMPAMPKRLK